MLNKPLLEVRNLSKRFPIHGGIFNRTVGHVHAVDGVSLDISEGETLGLVGESGCGKSTLGRIILRLLSPSGGQLIFDGHDITHLANQSMREVRRKMQIIFQDPYASLNPRMMVRDIIEEPLHIHESHMSSKRRIDRLYQLLDYVQLPKASLYKYPHEFSGGQRQRICIARALAVNPKFIVCDESVTALDVSIQAQVIRLLMELQQEFKLTYLFITHDLSVVKLIAHRIAVMYRGKIIEIISSKQLEKQVCHPYTKALLDAVPIPDPKLARQRTLLRTNPV